MALMLTSLILRVSGTELPQPVKVNLYRIISNCKQLVVNDYPIVIVCAPLSAIVNGEAINHNSSADAMGNFAFGTVATHSCSDGFFLMGNEMRVCGGDGTSPTGVWSGSEPVCSGNDNEFNIYT